MRQGSREVGVDDLDVTFAAPAANSYEETFGDAEALAQAIQALPPGQRQAVELLKLRELSLKRGFGADRLEHRRPEARHSSGDGVIASDASGNGSGMKTEELIERLGRESRVVQRLPSPGMGTAAWVVWCVIYMVVVALVMFAAVVTGGVRVTPLYLLQQAAALVTGITAARAAFASVIPGLRGPCGGCRPQRPSCGSV